MARDSPRIVYSRNNKTSCMSAVAVFAAVGRGKIHPTSSAPVLTGTHGGRIESRDYCW